MARVVCEKDGERRIVNGVDFRQYLKPAGWRVVAVDADPDAPMTGGKGLTPEKVEAQSTFANATEKGRRVGLMAQVEAEAQARGLEVVEAVENPETGRLEEKSAPKPAQKKRGRPSKK